MTITEIATTAHENASNRGFYGKDPEQAIKDKLDEELDELKTAMYCKDYKPFPNIRSMNDEEFVFAFERFIKDTVGGEFADIIITALSGSKELGIPIELYIESVLRHNSLRKYDVKI